jgi:chromosomal replication initiator protein
MKTKPAVAAVITFLEELNRPAFSISPAKATRRPGGMYETLKVIRQVRAKICSFYGVSESDLFGPSRRERTVWARHVAIFFCYEFSGVGDREIAAAFNRERTAAVWARAKVRETIGAYPRKKQELEQLHEFFRGTITL